MSLKRLLGSAALVKKMAALLTERGAEVLAPTNEYEVIRFRCHLGTCIVYRRSNGEMTASQATLDAISLAKSGKGVSLAPDQVTKRRHGGHRAGLIARLRERDGDECFFCAGGFGREPHRPDSLTIEDLVSKTHGGPEHISNKFLAHQRCNQMAGHMSAPEKIAMRDRMRAEGKGAQHGQADL